jgi:flavin reductase (DIM6/NTAB) family NADH-FMN oxidoreductase RutF
MERRVAQKVQRYFLTGVSMITSVGSQGQNVMAAEWTMQISYEPMLIAVFIHEGSSTLKNIKETKEFGVNVAAQQQTTVVTISGGYSRREIDKLTIRGSFQLQKSKKIKPPLISGCVINAECKLITIRRIGDHCMVVGKVVSIKHDKTKKPLVYHQGRYFRIGSMIQPIREVIKVNQKIFDLYSKEAKGKFILKCVGLLVRSGNKILISNNLSDGLHYTVPYVVPSRGQNHKKTLEKYLKKVKLNLILNQDLSLKRLILKRGRKLQRVNFILFTGKLKTKSSTLLWRAIKNDTFLQTLVK